MKKNIYILFAILGIAFGACNKDNLDRFPQTSISPNVFFNSEEDLALYVNGLLSLPDRGSYLSDQNSDNLATTSAVEIKNIMAGNANAQNITSGWTWTRLRNINYFLENYDKAAVNSEVKKHYVGLAKYYRAVFYLEKVKRYSDVPWYSTTLNPGSEELFKASDSRTLVIDSIMADLDFAYKNIREKVPTGTPNKWSAAAFYIRTALYEGTYRKYHQELNLGATANSFLEIAVKTSEEVMGSGKFSIYNTGKPQEDYAALFASQDLSSNPEVILNNVFDQTKNRGQNYNTTLFGEYEQSPARGLIQAYLMKDGTPFTSLPGYEQYSFVQEFRDRDPRLAQTIVYPGWIRAADQTPLVQKLNKNFTGYHQLKGYMNTTDNVILNGADFAVYRYAEVLLSYAEALAELGTLSQSHLDKSINLLRSRAGMPSLNLAQANATPDPILKQKYNNVESNQGVIFEIRRERRVELALEGFRFDDLMRWKAGKLLEKSPEGMYFPSLGKYDLTGDGIEDIILIDMANSIPAENQKEVNALGVKLIYYRTGGIGSDATVYLKNGTAGGPIVTGAGSRIFEEPKYYYRPIPHSQTTLNPNLKQLFGW